MKPIKIVERYPDGTVKYELWLKNGRLHHGTEPAYKSYYSNGEPCEEIYYLNGKIGRRTDIEDEEEGEGVEGNSEVAYRKWNNKKVLVVERAYHNTILHFAHLRWDDGKDKFIDSHWIAEQYVPERSWYSDGSLQYVLYSVRPSNGDPAYIEWDDKGNIICEAWGYKNRWHRNDGNPAIIEYYSSGQRKKKIWKISTTWAGENTKVHRDNGPAIQSWYEDGTPKTCKYYINKLTHKEKSQLHRTDGPAVQKWNEKGEIIVEEYYNILEKPTLTKNAK